MVVGISIFELHIPEARGLKPKRKVVKGLIERIHQRFRVSIIESDHHDLHQRSEVGIAVIARSENEMDFLLASIRELIESETEAVLIGWDPQIMTEG